MATTQVVRTYAVDKSHSEATFQVRHLLTKVRGRFADFDGAIEFDAANPEGASVTLAIQTASIDTSESNRDTHLRSADFFSVEEFPTITFRSSQVAKRGDSEFDVTGDLTIHGITKTITVRVAFLGAAKDPWGNTRVAFEGEYTINRKDFGLNWNAALETGGFLVGDDVKISVSIQAIAQ